MNINSKHYTYYLFFISIFFYNLFLTYLNYLPSNFFIGDGLTYKELSEKLFYEFKYYENFPEEYPYRSWRTPGYPIFLFLLKFIGIESANELFILNQIFLILTYLFFLNILFIFNPKDGLINLLLILLLYISHINLQFSYYIHNHNEPFYIFLITLGVYFIIKSIIERKELFIFLGLIILSFSCLVRTPTLPITTLVLVTLFCISFSKRNQLSTVKIFVYFITFYLFPLIWMIRNYFILDHFPFFLGSQSTHLLLGTFRYIDWTYIDTFAYDRINEFKNNFEIIRPSLITQEAISRILSDPIFYINTRIMNFLKYLINNYTFFSILVLAFYTFQKFFLKFNKVKLLIFLKSIENKVVLSSFLISIIFLIEMSMTFHVPRYGIIPSIFIMFFSNLLILKIIRIK